MKTSPGWLLHGLLLCALGFAPAVQAKQRILQLTEDSAQTRTLTAPGVLTSAPPTRVCEPSAKWIRLNFADLQLRSYDTLVLRSSGGDRYIFSGTQWNDRRFSARALRGSCIDIQPYFGSADSRYRIDSYSFGTQALEATSVVVAGAGDICDSTGTKCQGTSDLIVNINPTAVFTAGDNAYSSGTLSEYNTRYEPTWGRFKALTSPTPGNHDYNTSNASGYFDYFNGVGNQTGPAGDRSKGYYSYDVGDWHFVALNTMSGGTVATTQIDWLKADLAATAKPCVAAYFHHPLLSVGNYSGYSQVKPFYDALYAAHADLVLVGHDHNYQRYAKMDGSKVAKSDGLRQILVGTGGRSFYGISGSSALLEASNANTHGVLKLTLSATGYSGDFVPSDGSYTDSFSGTCNAKGASTNVPPVANYNFTSARLTATFTDASTDSDGTIAARSWNFGDGTTSTVTSPSHTYAVAGTYNVALTVTDNGGASHTVTKSVTVSDSSNTVLEKGVAKTNLSAATSASLNYTMVVPAGATNLTFTMSGGTGDADLYVKFGSAPTDSSYDCRPYKDGNAETCTFTAPSAGTYYVRLKAYSSFSGVSIVGDYTAGCTSNCTQTYSNTADYNIPDNNATGISSPITVSGRTGNAPANASISVNIVHPYVGDLKLDLIAPDGTVYNLRSNSGGSADNIVETYAKDLSAEALNGDWKLRVVDNASQDTGYINSWSITF